MCVCVCVCIHRCNEFSFISISKLLWRIQCFFFVCDMAYQLYTYNTITTHTQKSIQSLAGSLSHTQKNIVNNTIKRLNKNATSNNNKKNKKNNNDNKQNNNNTNNRNSVGAKNNNNNNSGIEKYFPANFFHIALLCLSPLKLTIQYSHTHHSMHSQGIVFFSVSLIYIIHTYTHTHNVNHTHTLKLIRSLPLVSPSHIHIAHITHTLICVTYALINPLIYHTHTHKHTQQILPSLITYLSHVYGPPHPQ